MPYDEAQIKLIMDILKKPGTISNEDMSEDRKARLRKAIENLRANYQKALEAGDYEQMAYIDRKIREATLALSQEEYGVIDSYTGGGMVNRGSYASEVGQPKAPKLGGGFGG